MLACHEETVAAYVDGDSDAGDTLPVQTAVAGGELDWVTRL
jgi:hypothetical protein